MEPVIVWDVGVAAVLDFQGYLSPFPPYMIAKN